MTKKQAQAIVSKTSLVAPSKQDVLVSCLLLGAGRWETAYKKECKKHTWQCSARLRKQVRELIAS